MSHFTAVYDACVLYPAPLRDLLMHLAMSNLFRAKWSDEIHEEWIRNVLKERPDLSREKLQPTPAKHGQECRWPGDRLRKPDTRIDVAR